MNDPNLLARFTHEPGTREIRVGLLGRGADLADRLNRELGTTDTDLITVAWLVASALFEHALEGGTVTLNDGRHDGLSFDVLEIAAYTLKQRQATGEIRTD